MSDGLTLRDVMLATRRLMALLDVGSGRVDDPPPGSELSAVLCVLAVAASPEHRVRKVCLN